MDKVNKLSSNYNSTPHTVQSANGGDVSVRNDRTGQVLRRNVVHLKRVEGKWTTVQEKGQDEVAEEESKDSEIN
ncbi:Uncharacterized protein OBRU01_19743 [Operophtera brumata]|uniref:Uncharacterized protein n=1 Tax=Operophtera brumata TaxID=104452 RepID=A0A0L7KW17_OPEBR|nr:Uncharacterized protein OBRU01_19743 [Operophtera brumata]